MEANSEKQVARQKRLEAGHAWVIAIGVGLSVIGFLGVRWWEGRQAFREFEYQSFILTSAIRSRLNGAPAALGWISVPDSAAQENTVLVREAFRWAVSQRSEMERLFWIRRVPHDARGAFEARAGGGLRIMQKGADGKLAPAERRDQHFPVCQVTAPDGEESDVVGLDVAADPALARVALQVEKTGRYVINRGVALGRSEPAGPGTLQVWLPVYPKRRGRERAEAGAPLTLAGIIVADIDATAAIEHGRSGLLVEDVDFLLTAPGPDNRKLLLHSSASKGPQGDADGLSAEFLSGRHWKSESDVLGEKWQFLCRPSERFAASRQGIACFVVLGVGLLLTYVVSVYVRQLIEQQKQLVENERLKTAQTMAKMAGRKLRQPMTSLLLALHYIELDEKSQDDKMTQMISETIDEMNGLLAQLIRITDMGEEEEAAVTDQLQAELVQEAAEQEAPVAEGTPRLLVIEDEDSVRKLMVLVVKDMGFDVDAVDNGEEAVERIKANDYGLALADIVLPGISGVEVYLESRKIKPDLPFLFLSGYPLKDEWLPVLERSAGFLSKPCPVEKIKGVLTRMFPQMAPAEDAAPAEQT